MLRKMVLLATAAVVLSGCGRTLYEFGAEQLRKDPKLRAEAMQDCVKDMQRESLSERKLMAHLMKVKVERVPQMFCRRLLTAVASGRLTYDKLYTTRSEELIRILQGG